MSRPASAEDAEAARLVAALAQGDADARVHTLSQIARLGHRAIPLVPSVARSLSDPEPRVRAVTAKLLRQLGPDASAAADALLARLEDPDRRVRIEAAGALRWIPAELPRLIPAVIASARKDPGGLTDIAVELLADVGPSAVPAMRDLLAEKEPTLVILGAKVLQRLGPSAVPAIGPLIEIGRRTEREPREQAAWALARCGHAAVSPLIGSLHDRDPRVRGTAARALELLAFRATEAIPALIEVLGDSVPPDDPRPPLDGAEGQPDSRLPRGYHAALAAMGPPALRALMAQLENPDRRRRALAMEAVGAFGPVGNAATPMLVHHLIKPGCRVEAAAALGRIGYPARAAVPMLITAAKNRDPLLRLRAVEALGEMSQQRIPPGETQLRALLAALSDSDARVRTAAIEALDRVGHTASKELETLIGDPGVEVRIAALKAICATNNRGESLVKAILACRHDPDRRVREEAVGAWLWGPRPEVHELIEALNADDPETRAAVASRLGQLDSMELPCFPPFEARRGDLPASSFAKVPGAGQALRARLEDPDPRVRTGVTYALAALPQESASTVPQLIDRLRDPAPPVRLAAAMVLGLFGPAARDAVPPLLSRLDDIGDGSDLMLTLPLRATKSIQAIRPDAAPLAHARLIDLLADSRAPVRAGAQLATSSLLVPMLGMLQDVLNDPRSPAPRRRGVARAFANCDSLMSLDVKTEIPELKQAIVAEGLRDIAFDLDEDDVVRLNAFDRFLRLSTDGDTLVRMILDLAGRARLPLPAPESLSIRPLSLPIGVMDEAFRDPDAEVRSIAAYLAVVNPDRLPAGEDRQRLLDRLISMLDDTDAQVRWAAIVAAGSIEFDANRARMVVERLRSILRDRATRLRPGSRIATLGEIAQWRGLFQVAGRTDAPKLRCAASLFLNNFQDCEGAAAALPELVDALKDDDTLVRQSALLAMGAFEGKATPAVDALIEALTEPGDQMGLPSDDSEIVEAIDGGSIRRWSAWALGQVGEPARRAVGPLIRALDDTNPSVREAAAESLGKFGAFDPTAIAALDRVLHNPFDRRQVQAAALTLGESGRPGVLPLLAALRSDDPDTRVLAANSIPQLAEESNIILPALRQAAQSEDFALRQAAGQAIDRLQKAVHNKERKPADNDEDGPSEEPR